MRDENQRFMSVVACFVTLFFNPLFGQPAKGIFSERSLNPIQTPVPWSELSINHVFTESLTFHDTLEINSLEEPGTAFFIELGGKPFYSFNVDIPMNRSNRIGFGFQAVYGGVIPNVMYYHLGGKNSRLELGGGFSVIWAGEESTDAPNDFRGIMVHGVIGYRYQKKNGLLFRIGFTPLFVSDVFLPMVGMSFGYSL